MLLIALLVTHALSLCTLQNPLLGCLSCSVGQSLAYQSINNSFYRTCTTIQKCSILSPNSTLICSQCDPGYFLASDNTTACLPSYGCFSGSSTSCTACKNGYVLNGTACALLNIPYCWKQNTTSCVACQYPYLTQSNCSVPVSMCSNFDYVTWRCVLCPQGQVLHNSGLYCIVWDPNCLIYGYNPQSCLQCTPGFYVQSTTCILGINLYLAMVSTYVGSPPITKCMNSLDIFNGTANSCSLPLDSSKPHCVTYSGTTCTGCVTQYYLNGSDCQFCLQLNCLSCSVSSCLECVPGYFLLIDPSTTDLTAYFAGSLSVSGQCMPCSILSCRYCRIPYGASSSVECLKCIPGYTLFMGTCIFCPHGTFFDLRSNSCFNCLTPNCQSCWGDSVANTCTWCLGGYVLDNQICVRVANLSIVTPANGVEYISKALSIDTGLLLNDQMGVVSSCNSSSNGFQCMCNQTLFTSRCTTIPGNLAQVTFVPLSVSQLISQLDYERLLSELPAYILDVNLSTGLLSIQQFASLLQITANILNRGNNTLINRVSSFAREDMQNVFPVEKATVLAGVGYYFKYRASLASLDDVSVLLSSLSIPSQFPEVMLVLFSGASPAITGSINVFTNTTTTVSVRIKKIGSNGNSQQSVVISGGLPITMATTETADGYITLPSVSTNTQSYQVTSLTTATAIDPYSSQRIENIILQEAYVYILFFLVLYLILLPTCSLVDFVDEKGIKRKSRSEVSQEDEEESHHVAIKVNYKDFFPIYNVANSPRGSKRLVKLCLFLVNTQHSVTFLTLIYFHLGSGNQIVGVVLAIPAYICTVLMGYLSALVATKLPHYFAYLVNLFTVLYWVLWVVLMPRFSADQYKPYIYIFTIIFFGIDLLMDLLETLLVYFTIRQDQQQLQLFNFLAKWLSYRGFYEFTALAKQIRRARDQQL